MHLSVLTPRHFTLVVSDLTLLLTVRQPMCRWLFEDQYWYPEILPTTKIPSELLSSEFTTTLLLSMSPWTSAGDVSGAYNSPSSSISSVDSDSFHHAMSFMPVAPSARREVLLSGLMYVLMSLFLRRESPSGLRNFVRLDVFLVRIQQDWCFTSCFWEYNIFEVRIPKRISN